MGAILTSKEWANITITPIYWRKITTEYKWDDFHFEMAIKWCASNLKGWVYYAASAHTFAFEDEDDTILFELWASKTNFHNPSGKI